MKSILRASLALLAVAASAAPALAQNLAKERGNIVAVDWGVMQVDIKDPQNRVGTWTVRRDAAVVFTDKKREFPNPKVSDLRPPMYVHFTFNADTKVIERFEVVEVGFQPSQGGPGIQRTGVITNLDASIGHVEVDLGSGAQTFAVDPKGQLGNFRVGDRVSILIETREGNREVVTQVRRVGSEPTQAGPAVSRNGVITNLDANLGHVEVNLGSGPQTFAVEPKEQLRNFRIGDRITILIETREVSRQVVTQIQRQ
jgi:Cu/Ag efflux protein CusF